MNRGKQGWSAESPEVRLGGGWVDLVAVSDWGSRSVRSWAVSITMAVACCVEAVAQALRRGQPDIFPTDQGAQLTRLALTDRLQHGGMRSSMEGCGRALDHVWVERWWRRVTDEEVYLRDYLVVTNLLRHGSD